MARDGPSAVANAAKRAPGSTGAPLKTVEELSEAIGWSWYQWRLFLFVGLCVAADSVEVNLLSFISVEATRDWQVEEFWEDTIAAAVFGGEVVGCALFGLFADRYGRLPAFLSGVAFVSAFGIASSLAGNLAQLIVMRFGVGVGIGGFSVPFDLLAETCPASIRGLVLCALWTFWTFGSVALNVLAAHCLRDEDGPGGRDPLGWRWLTFLAAVPPVISLCGIYVVDESPSWLAARGRHAEAREIILRAAKANGVEMDDDFEVAPEPENEAGVAQLFDESNVFRTTCLWLLNFLTHFGYYGVVLFLPRILGASAEDPYNFDALLLSCVGEVLGAFIACYFVQRVTRRKLLGWSALILAFSMPIVLMRGVPSWAMMGAALVARGAANTCSSLTWIVTPEGYNVDVRATGHSWGNLLARVGALSTTYWGGAAIAEPVKVSSYVAAAAMVVAVAVHMPNGVMRGSEPSAEGRGEGEGEGEDSTDAARKTRKGGNYGAAGGRK